MSMTREELQEAARKTFGEAGAADSGRTWELISELGFLMLAVPEHQGGLGLGNDGPATVQRELGRALVPGPAIAQMLTVTALAEAGEVELLERAMAGEVMTASLAGTVDGERLNAVPDADLASHVLVCGTDRVTLAPMSGASVTRRSTWDETRRLFDVGLAEHGITLADGESAKTLRGRLDKQLSLALAGDALGAADAALAMSVEYLKTRRQFDRPLAMFQALKHRCADLKTRLAAAESLFWSRAADPFASPVQVGALKAHATETACLIAEEAIQLHGGIGLTVEHPCHLYLKRAMLDAALGGNNDNRAEAAGRSAMTAT
ncbi:acyl-CoA dehydrogenase family protein [Sphingomonas tabacisoli]|uniref:Acyl-CoA dehydrogenase family protein n=1 Tax=Sphingomonas tabacisoli TaxID=2249466 RepID=A0ABW4I7I5_9SPHN